MSVQTNTNLLARLRPTPLSQSLSHEPVQPSNASFEFLATTIEKGDPFGTSNGLERGKSETHSRKGSVQPLFEGGLEVSLADHEAQSISGSSCSEDRSCGALLETDYRDGSIIDNVDGDRMDSEEGGEATPALQ